MTEETQNSEEVETTSKSELPNQELSLGEDVSVEDLGIDLDSLSLNSSTILGKAKPKPTLTDNENKRVGRPREPDVGIFAWCEQFQYTPGVEFLKLHRMFPKTWEGLGIGGFIEEVYEPIDEHWLVDRWGGGSYQLDAYQRDTTGRSRKTKTKCIEISGLPKAYMGSDGRPHSIVSQLPNSSNSRRSADVLRRRTGLGRMRRGDDSDLYDDSESMPKPRMSNIDNPLVDASQLYTAIQNNKKSENEALGVIREAQKDVHSQMQETSKQQSEMYKTLLGQQKEEMLRLREESRNSADASSAPFKEMLRFLSQRGGSEASSEALEALRQTHNTSIETLSKEHNTHLSELRRSYETRQAQIVDELQRVRTQYSSEIEQIRSNYLEREKSAKDDAFRMYQSQLETLRNQSSEIRERHRDELTTLQRDKSEMLTQLRQDIAELRATNLAQDSANRVALLEKENSLRREYLEREQLLQTKIVSLENLSRTEKLEERQRIKEEFEAQYTSKSENLTVSFDTRLKALQESSELKIEVAKKEAQAAADLRVTRLESEIRALKKEFEVKETLSLEKSKLAHESAQKERETQRLILENTSKSKEAVHDMKVLELKNALDAAKREQEHLAQHAEPMSQDPFEQLERLSQIKERLKSHGFVTEGKDGEDKDSEPEQPKDFLGKILHYGPQMVAPILQRIDAATAVAQQAVSQQQNQEGMKSRQELLEKQQRLEMERAAAIQREQNLREHREMLQQRRLEREEVFAQERHRVSMARSMEEVRHPPPPHQPTEELVENAEDPPKTEEVSEMKDNGNSTLDQVGEYLDKAFSEGKTIPQITSEISMAQSLGYFSKDDLQQLLGKDFETLMAEMKKFPNLRSPKSRMKIRQLINELKQ